MLTIDSIREIILPVCKRYMVKKVFLFGSYARGEATESSDIDLRIDGGEIKDLFTLSAFRLDMEEALGRDVDIISANFSMLDESLQENLRREEILVYAA